MKKLLITDLDDTLYGWLDFFVPSFYNMAEQVSLIIDVPLPQILDEYKELHRKYENVEFPFSTLELPCVKEKYLGKERDYIKEELDAAFYAFNSSRKHTLKLFDGVYESLSILNQRGIKIIGYTESGEENGYYRLRKLEVLKFFSKVYVYKSNYLPNLKINCEIPCYKVHIKKPSPQTLLKICEESDIKKDEAIYVGDSLTKDMYMAIQAGITCIWFNKKNTNVDLYQKLVDITHWTEDDFKKEKELKAIWEKLNLKPDYEIRSFAEIIPIIFGDYRG